MEIDDFGNEEFNKSNFGSLSSWRYKKRKKDEEDCLPCGIDTTTTKILKRERESSPSCITARELQELFQTWNISADDDQHKPLQIHDNTRQPLDTKIIADKIKRDLVERANELADEKKFLLYYKEIFNNWSTKSWSLRLGHIYIEIAEFVWKTLMKDRCNFLDIWIAVLREGGTHYVSRDSWNLFFEFCKEFNGKSFDNYDFKAAWPTLMDDFVTYVQAHHLSNAHVHGQT